MNGSQDLFKTANSSKSHRQPRILLLSVDNGLTPHNETIDCQQLEIIESVLKLFGWIPSRFKYHPNLVEDFLNYEKPDVIFNMAYGYWSSSENIFEEQADIVSNLEKLGYSFVGSTSSAQRLAQDKLETAKVLESYGIKSPEIIDPNNWPDDFSLAVLKPRRGACHSGVRVVTKQDRHKLPIGIGENWLLQHYIDGPEYTVAVFEDPDDNSLVVFPPLRIIFQGIDCSKTIMSEVGSAWSVRIEKERLSDVETVARQIFLSLGLRDFARLDFRISSNGPVLLDANSLPSMNPIDGFYATAAAAGGLDYHILIKKLATRALQRCK